MQLGLTRPGLEAEKPAGRLLLQSKRAMMADSTNIRAVGRERRKESRKILRKKNQQDLVIESTLAGRAVDSNAS